MYGICIDTQICYLLALVARCVWIFDTQLATMNLTYVEVWIGLTTQVWVLWQCHSFKDILYHDKKSIVFKWFSVVGLCTVLSIILHPGKKGDFFFTLQMLVSFTIFIEAVAMIPQLNHLYDSKDVDGLNIGYLGFLGFARLVRIGFWYVLSSKLDSFWYLISADLIHTILLGGFFHLFTQLRKQKRDILGAND